MLKNLITAMVVLFFYFDLCPLICVDFIVLELLDVVDITKETFQVISESYDQPWIVHEEVIGLYSKRKGIATRMVKQIK